MHLGFAVSIHPEVLPTKKRLYQTKSFWYSLVA